MDNLAEKLTELKEILKEKEAPAPTEKQQMAGELGQKLIDMLEIEVADTRAKDIAQTKTIMEHLATIADTLVGLKSEGKLESGNITELYEKNLKLLEQLAGGIKLSNVNELEKAMASYAGLLPKSFEFPDIQTVELKSPASTISIEPNSMDFSRSNAGLVTSILARYDNFNATYEFKRDTRGNIMRILRTIQGT